MAATTILVLLLCACGLSTAQTLPPKLPNIGYIGYGYNVFTANPHASNHFDPGFGQVPIFDFTYNQQQTTADGKWLVPDNVVVPGAATECSVQGTSQTIQYTYSYMQSLSIDASFDISGYGASFSASTDYKQVEQSTSDDSDVYISSSASCQTYLVDINPFVHPNFSTVIAYQGSILPTTFDPSNASAFWEFFDLVGTHFPTQIVFGSRWGYSFQSTLEQWTTMEKMGLDVDVAASYAGMIKAGVSVNTSYAQQMAQNFTSQTTQTFEWGLGLPPPTSGDTETWLQQSLSSTLMDPLQYTLTNISMLFSEYYSSDSALHARYQAVNAALAQYCAIHLIGTNVLTSCDQPPFPPPPPPPNGFGALACGQSNGNPDCYHSWAAVFDGASNIEAQEIVLDFCPTCTIETWVQYANNGCIALAVSSSNSAWGAAWNYGSNTDQEAISACETYSKGATCVLAVSGCASPPPTDVQWGAIACTGGCDSYSATKQGFPDRIEAHKVAMESLQNSFVAIDFDQCAAIAKSKSGFAASGGDTPQDATNAAMQACQTNMQDCSPLTYACVSPTLAAHNKPQAVPQKGQSMGGIGEYRNHAARVSKEN